MRFWRLVAIAALSSVLLASAQRITTIRAFINVSPNQSALATTTPSAIEGAACEATKACKHGIIIPVWQPQNVDTWTHLMRALVYLLALFWLFLGVSIVSDRFMAAIEVITSQEKAVQIVKPNGEKKKVLIRVW